MKISEVTREMQVDEIWKEIRETSRRQSEKNHYTSFVSVEKDLEWAKDFEIMADDKFDDNELAGFDELIPIN